MKIDHEIINASGWSTDNKLRNARQYVITDAVRDQRTIADKEETCTRHGCKTVYSGMLGLWPCPECAREERGRRPIERKASLPYKDEPEPPEIVEVDNFNELDKYFSDPGTPQSEF
jgi:hypothetical protein